MNPIYYVCFSTSTILASLILFRGLNTTGGSNTTSLLCGFYIISLGVYLLKCVFATHHDTTRLIVACSISRSDPEGTPARANLHSVLDTGIIGSRISMSGTRLSMTSDNGSLPMNSHQRTSSADHSQNPRRGPGGIYRAGAGANASSEVLFDTFSYPDERDSHGLESHGLEQLDEEDESEDEMGRLVGSRREKDQRHPALDSGVVRGSGR